MGGELFGAPGLTYVYSFFDERLEGYLRVAFPLRTDGRLHAVALVEIGAQAAAAHASLHGIGTRHVGLLLALRSVEPGTAPDSLPAPLTAEAARLGSGPEGARYRFRVHGQGRTVVSGEATLSFRAVP